jgi:putative pyruvate formate lyase activating enzyme
MSQYEPLHKALEFPLLSRRVSVAEYEKVIRLLRDMGMENGWTQEMGASESYIPDFEQEGHPFISTSKKRE